MTRKASTIRGTAEHKSFKGEVITYSYPADALKPDVTVKFSNGERTSLNWARFVELFDVLPAQPGTPEMASLIKAACNARNKS